jgi:hypothetical protein
MVRLTVEWETSGVRSGIECGLPGNTAHLLAEGACLKGNAVVGVIDHVELPPRRQRRCFS